MILLAEELGAGKVTACVSGGEERAGLVRAGLVEIRGEGGVGAVRERAQPLLPSAVVERVLAPLADGWDGAVAALPVADTLKLADPDGLVLETVARERLYAAQTPQAFVASTLRQALAASGVSASDCAGFVEAAGGRVRLVEGDPQLVKVTSSADLAFVERALASPA